MPNVLYSTHIMCVCACVSAAVCHSLQIRAKLKRLQLSNKAVWNREHAREAAGGGVDTPWIVKGVYYALCIFLDVAYNNRCVDAYRYKRQSATEPHMYSLHKVWAVWTGRLQYVAVCCGFVMIRLQV